MSVLEAQATAPGKLILMGEHAAVYGVPAVVASLGLRTEVRVGPASSDSDLELNLADLGLAQRFSRTEVLEYGERRRALWRAYENHPSAESFSALRAGDEAGLVKVVVAEVLRFLERSSVSGTLPKLRLSVRSELPVGSGFGSSASVAVAVAAALLALATGSSEPEPEWIATVANEAEKRQHGRPSGIDHTTVMRGGFLLLARGDGGLRVEELARPSWLRSGLQTFDTGTPAESTGEVVAAVRDFKARHPDRFAVSLARIEDSVREFAECLGRVEPTWNAVLRAVGSAERALEAIGVVPQTVRDAVRRIEAAGGAAKISGAGTLTGESAGSLIVFWPPEASGDPSRVLGDYEPLAANLGVAGLDIGLVKKGEHAEI